MVGQIDERACEAMLFVLSTPVILLVCVLVIEVCIIAFLLIVCFAILPVFCCGYIINSYWLSPLGRFIILLIPIIIVLLFTLNLVLF